MSDTWYPAVMPEAGRYRYCPMCRSNLSMSDDLDGVSRVGCEPCGWTYFPCNVLGVNVVPVTEDGEIVILLPPGEPEDAPAALPGGVVEYGELPEQAAVREVYEETGFRVELVRDLGRWFDPFFPYGPMLSLMFEARVVGGTPNGSHEGDVLVVPPAEMPPISPSRRGSQTALAAWLSQG